MKKRVKELRKILNLTQTEFSNSINLKQNSYSKIENGRVALTERNIKTICEKFNVNEDWLRNGNEPIFNNDCSNMEINQRIKFFRTEISKNDKGKNYSQRQFAEKLGVSHGVINNIESNLVEAKDHIIKLICQTFNVNEDWLRNGNEPIFIDKDNNNYINELIKKYDINSNEINILKKLINIDENTRNKIINFMFDIIKENIDKIDENKILNISKNIPKNVGITDEDIINFNNNSNKNIKKDTY